MRMDIDGIAREGLAPLLGPGDLSQLLGVPVATLANWRCAGHGPPFLKVGRHVRYRSDDIAAWVDARVTQPGVVTPGR